jgi:gliding motility-associated-like protein
MIWKTTLSKKFFAAKHLKSFNHTYQNIDVSKKPWILSLIIAIYICFPLAIHAQENSCKIISTGCSPKDIESKCGDVKIGDAVGNYVSWSEPKFALECGGESGHQYEMSFDLPESQENCWSFSKVQRVGDNGGILKLWQSNGRTENPTVTSPSFYINELLQGSLEIYSKRGQSFKVNIRLKIPGGATSNILSNFVVTGNDALTLYPFQLDPSTFTNEAKVFKIEFEFVPLSGNIHNNDNYVDLITFDTSLFGTACAEEANFVVTKTHNPGDFFPVGTTKVTYTATCNGCDPFIEQLCSFDVTVNPAPTAEAGGTAELNCSVETLPLNGSGSGQGTLSYKWTTTDGTILSGANTATPEVSSEGTYKLIVTDENGCSATDTVEITKGNNLPTAEAGEDKVLNCKVTSLELDGSNSNGVGLSYAWTTTNGTIESSDPNQAKIFVSAAGTYKLKVTDQNECSAIDTVEITQAPETFAEAGETTELSCSAQTHQLNGSGLGQGTLTYAWTTTDGTIDKDANTPNPTISSKGTYTLTVTDENNCTASDTVKITQAPDTTAEAGDTAELNCSVETLQLNGSGSGKGTLSYAWTTTDGTILSGANTATPEVSSEGTYKLTVTDENGCSATDTVEITKGNNSPTAEAGEDKVLNCIVTSLELDGSNSNGVGLSYAWTTTNGTIESSEPNQAKISVSAAGTYKLKVTDQNDCSAIDTVEITDSNLTAKAGEDQILSCSVTSVELDGINSNGVGLSYAWTTTNGTIESLDPNQARISVSAAGTYKLEVTDQNGCSDIDTVLITEDPYIPTAKAGEDQVLTCSATILKLDGKTSSGEGKLSYAWTTTNGTILDKNPNKAKISVNAAGTYVLKVIDENGCFDTDEVEITQNTSKPTPPVLIGTPVQPTCAAPKGSFAIDSEPGLTYSINNGNYTETTSFTELSPNTYTVVAKNENGCTSEPLSVTISQPVKPDPPSVHVTVHPSCGETTGSFGICCDDGEEYSIDGVNFQHDPLFLELAPGTYKVVAKNAEGCISEPTSVTINPAPETPEAPLVTAVEQPSCEVPTGSFTVTTEAGLEYSIDGTNWQTDGSFENLTADAVYEVMAKNADGCISEPTSVTINPAPETPEAPVVTAVEPPNCELPTGSFTVTTKGGLEYSIDGTNWQTEGSFENLTADAVYEVMAKNADGCLSEPTSVTIEAQTGNPAAPAIASTQQPSCEVPTGSFIVTTQAGLEYSIDGTNWQTHGSFENLTADAVYEVMAKNADGCISEPTSVTIEALAETPAAPVIESSVQPTCATPTGSFIVTAEDGMEYSVNDGAFSTSASFEDLTPDTYTVVARNSSGCISQAASITFTAPDAAVVETSGPQSVCIDESDFNLNDMLLGDYDESGTWNDPANTGALENGIIDPSLLDLKTYTFDYVIQGDCPSTTSVQITINDDCVVLPCELEDIKGSISKAVTPNGDNINDYFTIGLNLECGFTYDVQIFNRWGNEVFKSKNYKNDWNGTSNSSFTGDQLPAGTYYYIVHITGLEAIQGYIYLGTK